MESAAPAIVIVHETPAKSETLCSVIESLGYRSIAAESGEALARVSAERAKILVVSVGVSDPMFFELIDGLRADSSLAETKVLLIGSVHNEQAYRRSPSERYGADELVEESRLEAELPEKLARLLDPKRVLREDPAYARVRGIADVIVAEIAMQYPREVALPDTARSERWTSVVEASRRRLTMVLESEESTQADWIGLALERLTSELEQG